MYVSTVVCRKSVESYKVVGDTLNAIKRSPRKRHNMRRKVSSMLGGLKVRAIYTKEWRRLQLQP